MEKHKKQIHYLHDRTFALYYDKSADHPTGILHAVCSLGRRRLSQNNYHNGPPHTTRTPRPLVMFPTALTWFLVLLGCLHQQLATPTPLTSALYLGPQQQQQAQQQQGQQMSDLASNGAIIQALNQFAAQQVAGGVPSGSLQVAASTGSNGAVSISSSSMNNNQNLGLVNTSVQAPQQQQQAASSSQQQGVNSNQFVIKWIHNDPKNQMAYVSITPINYTNLHEPRIELRYQSKHPFVSLNESSANNTVVAAVVVQDEDTGANGETSLSIEQGNELNHFKLVSTAYSNTIQVNGAPLSRHRVPEYNLTIVARDHGSPPKSSSSNLVIKLHPSPHSGYSNYAQANIAAGGTGPGGPGGPGGPHFSSRELLGELQPSMKPPPTDLLYVGAMLVCGFAALIVLIIVGCAFVPRPPKHATPGKPPSSHPARPPVGPQHHQQQHHHQHKSLSGLGLATASRATSATNSRIIPPSGPTDQCSAYCLSGYNLTNL